MVTHYPQIVAPVNRVSGTGLSKIRACRQRQLAGDPGFAQ
jgi:hypothetical protein